MPKILFVHENYPAQFGALAQFLRGQGWDVMFATAAESVPHDNKLHATKAGVQLVRYKRHRDGSAETHHYLRSTEKAVLNGQGFARTAAALHRGGYAPDVIVGHSGWGSASLAKVIWPDAKYVQYLEWWYNHPAADFPEADDAKSSQDRFAATLCRNLPFLLDAQTADVILVPTAFQASMVPDWIRPRVQVLHDGVDTDFYRPRGTKDDVFNIDGLPADARIVTYATRGMEPMRGFGEFMQAWEKVQNRTEDVHCVIAGRDSVHYAKHLSEGESYKSRALKDGKFDMDRLHFTGLLPRPAYRQLLQRSAVHVYLTRPFVLSWSMIEAMATGCPLVVSENAATAEALGGDECAKRVALEAPEDIAEAIAALLRDQNLAEKLGQTARKRAVDTYSTKLLFPAHAALFTDLLAKP